MKIPTALFALLSVLAAPMGPNFAIAARWCSPTTSLCYAEFVNYKNVAYRIAIPTEATAAPYDIALQIVAPRSTGWASISWGGQMINAPLTIAWLNGNNVVVSSQYTTMHKQPTAYTGATYTTLKDTAVNGTHWTLSVVCKGCSQWTSSSRLRSLNPASANIELATALNTNPGTVYQPSNPASSFDRHDAYQYFTQDFKAAKATNFPSTTKTS